MRANEQKVESTDPGVRGTDQPTRPRPKRTYSDDERQQAISVYSKQGPIAASDATGIPRTTINEWARAAGIKSPVVAPPKPAPLPAVKVAKVAFAERRRDLTDRFGEVAAKALAKADQLIDADRVNEAKTAVLAAAIATDKANLLSGGATVRLDIGLPSLEESLSALSGALGLGSGQSVIEAGAREVARAQEIGPASDVATGP